MAPKDVQNQEISNGFPLTRVGITDLKKPVTVMRNGRKVVLVTDIDAFVDLPASQKGSHMSRNVEVITEMIESIVHGKAPSLEELSAKICQQLLEKHEYASYAEVHMSADYFLERITSSNRKTLEAYKLLAKGTAKRGAGLRRMIGVEVSGMTACPCAMESVRHMLRGKDNHTAQTEKTEPSMTHNQRNFSQLLVEVPEGYDVEADDLIDLVESSLSSPTYAILKREDEAQIVIDSHRNPKFVEDVVREILYKVLEKYDYLPDDVLITVRSESEESIHKHNAFAERVTTLRELRGNRPA